MRYRNPPVCMFCGEVNAKAIHYDKPDGNNTFYGDTFSHWDYSDHFCHWSDKFHKKLDEAKKRRKDNPSFNSKGYY